MRKPTPLRRYVCLCGSLWLIACAPSSSDNHPGPSAGGNGSGGSVSATPGTGGTATGGAPSGTGGASPATGGSPVGPVATGGSPSPTGGASTGGTAVAGRGAPAGGQSGSNGGGGAGGSGAGGSGASGSIGGSPAGGRSGAVDPGTEGDGDLTVGPNYTVSPDLAVKNVPHATRYQFTMSAAMSTIFPGNDAVLNTRTQWTRSITVFIPKQYVDGAEAPFLVVQDGNVGGNGTPQMVTMLENLAADPSPARRIPPIVAIFVPNGGGDGPGSERGLEYDTVSDRYSRFINMEVLPAVQANAAIKAAYPNFKLTTDPEGKGAYGCSSGSPAAFGLGWFADYRRIVTYSGTFVDLQKADAATEMMSPFGAWGYAAMITAAPAKPLRVFLQVAQNDNGANETEEAHLNWILANRHMAAALKEKGYHYRFVYALGAGHCDSKVQQQTWPDTFVWMWHSYQPK